jgi:hypothetical protein
MQWHNTAKGVENSANWLMREWTAQCDKLLAFFAKPLRSLQLRTFCRKVHNDREQRASEPGAT